MREQNIPASVRAAVQLVCLLAVGLVPPGGQIQGAQMQIAAPPSLSSDSIEFIQHAPSSAQAADDLEASLKTSPEDRIGHVRLMGYYWQQTLFNRPDVRRKLLEQADWFVTHEPQSVVFDQANINLKPADFAPPNSGDLVLFKAHWKDAVERHPDDVQVQLHALHALQSVDHEVPLFSLKRLRVLLPSNPQFALQLAGEYVQVIDVQWKSSGGDSAALSELAESKDSAVIGLAGQMIFASARLGGRTEPFAVVGKTLLSQAHDLDPADDRWSGALVSPPPATLADILATMSTLRQEDLWVGGKVQGIVVPRDAVSVDPSVQASKLALPSAAFVRNVLATPLGPGEVQLLAIIGPDGRVEQLQFEAGSVRHFANAMSIAKGWRYTPTLVNGQPVPVVTHIDLKFTAPLPGAAMAGVAGMAGVTGGVMGSLGPGSPVVAQGPPGGPMRLSAGVVKSLLREKTDPIYPPVAKAAHVQGAVILHAVISKTGTIENVAVISGPPLLQQSAIDAVNRWKYRPYLLNGVPTAVDTTITVNFTIADPAPAAPQTPQN